LAKIVIGFSLSRFLDSMGVRGFWVLGKSANTNIYMFLPLYHHLARLDIGDAPFADEAAFADFWFSDLYLQI
jgi:hypothetical protein